MKKIIIAVFILFLAFSLNPQDTFSQDTNYVLFEYQTGTWCGYCPCGHQILEQQIMATWNNIVVISYHGGGSDPWASYSAGIRALLNLQAYPRATIGRRTGTLNRAYWVSNFSPQASMQPGVRIETTKSYNSSTRELDVTALVTALTNLPGTYMINFVLTEGNIMYPQNFYSSCGTPGYHNDYIHQHVCKGMINGDIGDTIFSGGTWNQGDTISKSINYTIPAGFVDNNCTVAIFVYMTNTSFGINNYVQQSTEVNVGIPTGLSNNGTIVSDYNLSQNYPNPFNPTTNIHFTIPKDGNTSLKVYDVVGNEVVRFYDGFLKAGAYNAEFNGSTLSSGVYFYTLKAGDFVETKKMVLMK